MMFDAHLQLAALDGEGVVVEVLHGAVPVAHHEAQALPHPYALANRHRASGLVKPYQAPHQEVLCSTMQNVGMDWQLVHVQRTFLEVPK